MKKTDGPKAARFKVFGVVQGVGFRPFVYRLAHALGLTGWVRNSGYGVEIHVEGPPATVDHVFPERLTEDLPPLARIESLDSVPAGVLGFRDFRIKKTGRGSSFVFISPDIATCPDCLAEIMTPGGRRFGYPFTNCTNCGPRYTIVKDLPYDRPNTTMAGFKMCPECRREYEDPLDRRHHAQPIACPICGPQLLLKETVSGRMIPGGIKEAASLIKSGKILAVKGLGGFHLICDPFNRRAVERLRKLKRRQRKPLALMARDITGIAGFAEISPAEQEFLVSARAPIVLLKKKKDIPLIAPNLNEMGFMLPYTPLHHLLLRETGLIVATSSNSKDAPIMKDEDEEPGKLADFLLTHNRPIAMRADDSVLKVVSGERLFLRRARGYVPYPQRVPPELGSGRMILALGAELKDTISIHKGGYVITSQFLGDLDDYRNFAYFRETLHHLSRLFDLKPEAVVTDMHPGFVTTRFADGLGIPHLKIQHHYAHALAVMLEHGHIPRKKVLAAVLDGYGYGTDGGAWGGEFLLADFEGFKRFARFRPVHLPGLDKAAVEPWRMALSYLADAFGPDIPKLECLEKVDERKRRAVMEMIKTGFNTLLTSSCGRLFDGVSFLTGLAPEKMEFEAEAAMRLEAACAGEDGEAYTFEIQPGQNGIGYEVSFRPAIKSLVEDIHKNVPSTVMAGKFHRTIGRAVTEVALAAKKELNVDCVILSGGCFLNKVLLEDAQSRLADEGFKVLRPVEYSPNDESISVGQIAWALSRINKSGRRISIRS